jgi:hypothetical protein
MVDYQKLKKPAMFVGGLCLSVGCIILLVWYAGGFKKSDTTPSPSPTPKPVPTPSPATPTIDYKKLPFYTIGDSNIPFFDLSNFPTTNMADCESKCRDNDQCNWYNWNGNACWLKKATQSNNTTIGMRRNDGTFIRLPDKNIPGFDLGIIPLAGKDLNECESACKADPQCSFYAWNTNKLCWKKKPQDVKGTTTGFKNF